jgi:hypothetical protein
MIRIFWWFRVLFHKKTKTIDMPRIQILSTGQIPITEEDRIKFEKEMAACIQNRILEYPSWESVIEAIVEERSGNSAPLQAVIRKRRLVKKKYPKPTL